MSSRMRIIWLMMSCLFLGGCSAYKSAGLPQVSEGRERKLQVQEGNKIRLNLVDGSVDEGWVLEVTPAELVLVDHVPRSGESIGERSRTIRTENISSVKVKKTHAGKTVALTLGILGAGIIALFAATFESVNFGG